MSIDLKSNIYIRVYKDINFFYKAKHTKKGGIGEKEVLKPLYREK